MIFIAHFSNYIALELEFHNKKWSSLFWESSDIWHGNWFYKTQDLVPESGPWPNLLALFPPCNCPLHLDINIMLCVYLLVILNTKITKSTKIIIPNIIFLIWAMPERNVFFYKRCSLTRSSVAAFIRAPLLGVSTLIFSCSSRFLSNSPRFLSCSSRFLFALNSLSLSSLLLLYSASCNRQADKFADKFASCKITSRFRSRSPQAPFSSSSPPPPSTPLSATQYQLASQKPWLPSLHDSCKKQR